VQDGEAGAVGLATSSVGIRDTPSLKKPSDSWSLPVYYPRTRSGNLLPHSTYPKAKWRNDMLVTRTRWIVGVGSVGGDLCPQTGGEEWINLQRVHSEVVTNTDTHTVSTRALPTHQCSCLPYLESTSCDCSVDTYLFYYSLQIVCALSWGRLASGVGGRRTADTTLAWALMMMA